MHRSVAIILCVLLASCTSYRYVAKDEGLAQNWDEEDRRDFYHMSQGSQLVKYDWFVALEHPNPAAADPGRGLGSAANACTGGG